MGFEVSKKKGLGNFYKVRGKTFKVGTEFVVNKTGKKKNARVMTLQVQHKKHPGKICLNYNNREKLVAKKHVKGIVKRVF